MSDIQTPQELKTRLNQKNSNDILLDVRTPQEFQDGHIAGAVNFDISGLGIVGKIEILDKSKSYIVYCKSGGRSAMAAMLMKQKGFDVTNCQFGFMHLDGSDLEIT